MSAKTSGTKIVKTGAWSAGPGCHGGCGVELSIRDGRLVKVEGDETHPYLQGRLCPRALAMTQYVYHPDRLTHPLKRAGARGEGKWQRISWDEALDTCEQRMRDIRDKYGAESMVFGQGTGRDAGGYLIFLAYAYGSPNWTLFGLSGISCFTPRLAAMSMVMGDFSRTRISRARFISRASVGNMTFLGCTVVSTMTSPSCAGSIASVLVATARLS